MRVMVQSILPCCAELAWEEVQTSRLLLEVIRPLAAVHPMPGESFPAIWREDTQFRCRCYLLGFIPIGTRELVFERIDSAKMEIQSRESDPLIRHWDHLIAVESVDPDRCRYRDTIDIDAGLLTPFVWLFARIFYAPSSTPLANGRPAIGCAGRSR